AEIEAGDPAVGLRTIEDVWKVKSTWYPPDSWQLAHLGGLRGHALAKLRRFQEAEPLLIKAHETLRADPGCPPIRRLQACERLAALYDAMQAPEKATAVRDQPIGAPEGLNDPRPNPDRP